MTTITYRSGTMAADSGSWAGDAAHGWADKLAKGPDGTLYGVSGNAAEAMGFLEWVRGDCVGAQPKARAIKDDDNSFIVLAVPPSGPVRIITAHGEEKYEAPYYAIGAGAATAFGAGAATAFGALYAGASAEGAVKAAIEHGCGAFGAVRTIRLGDSA